MSDNNTVLIIGIIVVAVLFLYFQQQQKPSASPHVPSEEGHLPPLPDYRHNPQLNQELHKITAGVAELYDMCLKGCSHQSDPSSCKNTCRQAVDKACDKVEAECPTMMARVDVACKAACMQKGYPEHQCDQYCAGATNYICDELDHSCQAGLTPV